MSGLCLDPAHSVTFFAGIPCTRSSFDVMCDVLRERDRQVVEKGYAAEHDDRHGPAALAVWATDYIAPDGFDIEREALVKATAVLVAAIESHDRLTAAGVAEDSLTPVEHSCCGEMHADGVCPVLTAEGVQWGAVPPEAVDAALDLIAENVDSPRRVLSGESCLCLRRWSAAYQVGIIVQRHPECPVHGEGGA